MAWVYHGSGPHSAQLIKLLNENCALACPLSSTSNTTYFDSELLLQYAHQLLLSSIAYTRKLTLHGGNHRYITTLLPAGGDDYDEETSAGNEGQPFEAGLPPAVAKFGSFTACMSSSMLARNLSDRIFVIKTFTFTSIAVPPSLLELNIWPLLYNPMLLLPRLCFP